MWYRFRRAHEPLHGVVMPAAQFAIRPLRRSLCSVMRHLTCANAKTLAGLGYHSQNGAHELTIVLNKAIIVDIRNRPGSVNCQSF